VSRLRLVAAFLALLLAAACIVAGATPRDGTVRDAVHVAVP
jgi:hypothetical protein